MKLRVLFLSIFLLGCCGLMDMHTICAQTSDPNIRDKCMSNIALSDRNSTECGEVRNATVREYCIMKVAIIKLNEFECTHMENSTLRQQCNDVVLRIRDNNSFACTGIADNDTAELCRMRVS